MSTPPLFYKADLRKEFLDALTKSLNTEVLTNYKTFRELAELTQQQEDKGQSCIQKALQQESYVENLLKQIAPSSDSDVQTSFTSLDFGKLPDDVVHVSTPTPFNAEAWDRAEKLVAKIERGEGVRYQFELILREHRFNPNIGGIKDALDALCKAMVGGEEESSIPGRFVDVGDES